MGTQFIVSPSFSKLFTKFWPINLFWISLHHSPTSFIKVSFKALYEFSIKGLKLMLRGVKKIIISFFSTLQYYWYKMCAHPRPAKLFPEICLWNVCCQPFKKYFWVDISWFFWNVYFGFWAIQHNRLYFVLHFKNTIRRQKHSLA